MKFNKIAKKFAAAALAGVLAVSTMGISASATTGVTGTEGQVVSSVTLSKSVTTDGNTYKPNTVFAFTVSTAAAGTYDGNVVYEGETGGLTGTTITSTPSTRDELSEEYTYSGSLTVNADVFKKAGVYHYTVTEDSSAAYEGITYDETTYDVYLYVMNDTKDLDGDDSTTDFYVEYVVVVKTTTEGDVTTSTKSELSFTNDYGKTNDTTHDVTVKKVITGDMSVESDEFDFTVSVTGAEGEIYKVVVTGGSDAGTYSITSGGSLSVKLGHNDTVTIYGLTENDTYTVTEASNSDGYVVSDDCETATDGIVSGKVTVDNTSYTVTNTKNATTPTGIALSIAPYVLMVAFAGVIAVMFLRKRNYEI